MEGILNYILTTIIGIMLGFVINTLKNMKLKSNSKACALKTLLKSNLVNQYYVYKEIGRAPYSVKQSWNDMFDSYTDLGGNSFVKDDIKPKWDAIESYDD